MLSAYSPHDSYHEKDMSYLECNLSLSKIHSISIQWYLCKISTTSLSPMGIGRDNGTPIAMNLT
ncbi:hypothetical protein SFRURICE_004451 [Spodoptera frugiperda]|nr:hypothetical protein SFRURICE_004451 [Spodoptera frugiperda]